MLACFAALLSATIPHHEPLPDASLIDRVEYSIGVDTVFGGKGSLAIAASGKVAYNYWSRPHTGSGGKNTKLDWEIPPGEAAKVIRDLVGAGMMKLPIFPAFRNTATADPTTYSNDSTFRVRCGRWHSHYFASPTPEKLLAVLQPMLVKAHPDLWKPDKPPEKPRPPALEHLEYSYDDVEAGHVVSIGVNRGGNPRHSRYDRKPPGKFIPVENDSLKLDGENASAKLLDALFAAGVADLKEDPFLPARHGFVLSCGDFRMRVRANELTEPVKKLLQPLLDLAAMPPKK